MVSNTSYATEIIFHKHIEENGDIVEIRVWKVPRSSACPEGISYSLVCIRGGRRLVGYDNENRGTGISNHHKHLGKRIIAYEFVDEWRLLGDFSDDLDKIKRGSIK